MAKQKMQLGTKATYDKEVSDEQLVDGVQRQLDLNSPGNSSDFKCHMFEVLAKDAKSRGDEAELAKIMGMAAQSKCDIDLD